MSTFLLQKDLNLDFEDVSFETTYGATLRGWFVAAPPNVVRHNIGICFIHGGGRDRRAWLRHVPLFHTQGYDSLLFDLSEHGTSDGRRRGFSYGIRELHDVISAVRFMKQVKGLKRVVVVGTSVGGSSAIMAAAVDSNIDAVIAENAVASPGNRALFPLHIRIHHTLLHTYNTSHSHTFKPYITTSQ